jgi:hypothetical protein
MDFLHGVFSVFKFIFGLGALGTLIAVGVMLLWFLLRFIVRLALAGQPADTSPLLRKLFLEP